MTDTDRDDLEIHAGLEPTPEHVVVGVQPTLEQATISAEIAERHRSEREAAGGGALPDASARATSRPTARRRCGIRRTSSCAPTPRRSSSSRPRSATPTWRPRRATSRSSTPGEPLGERIIVTGRILDGDGRPVRNQLVEIWQANAAGRYVHKRDQHPAPLDPNFTGVGRVITGDDGGYRLTTIKPGAYPWKNHRNAWRPAHIHFSFFGSAFTQRLITQMYFPGDPLFALDPIYQSIVDPAARDRLVARYDHDVSEPEWALGYRWDVVLTGSRATWMEPEDADHA